MAPETTTRAPQRNVETSAEPQSAAAQTGWGLARGASVTNLFAGLWLLFAPFVLGYHSATGTAVANDLVLGIAIAALAGFRAARPERGVAVSWITLVLGGWLLIAPFVLGYGIVGTAAANDVIVGVIVGLVSLISIVAGRLTRTEQAA